MSSIPSIQDIRPPIYLPLSSSQGSINESTSNGTRYDQGGIQIDSNPRSINLYNLKTQLTRAVESNDYYDYEQALEQVMNIEDKGINDAIYLIDSSITDLVGNTVSITRERRKMVEITNNTIYQLKKRQLNNTPKGQPIPMMASTLLEGSTLKNYDYDANDDLTKSIKVRDYHSALYALNQGADNYEEALDDIVKYDYRLILLNEKREVIQRIYAGIPIVNLVTAAKASDYSSVQNSIDTANNEMYQIAFSHLMYDINRHDEYQRTYLSLLDASGIKLKEEDLMVIVLLNATMILKRIMNNFDTYIQNVNGRTDENYFVDYMIKKAMYYDSPDILEMMLFTYRKNLTLNNVIDYYQYGVRIVSNSRYRDSLNQAFRNLADNVTGWSKLKYYIRID